MAADVYGVNPKFVLRWTYILLVSISAAYLLSKVVQRTEWYKDHLYRQLLTDDAKKQKRAAVALARLGAQDYLLRRRS